MKTLSLPMPVAQNVPLRDFTTLHVGGPADALAVARSADELARAVCEAGAAGIPLTLLGGGSNVLVADEGVRGLVLINAARHIEFDEDGALVVETGAMLQDVFLTAAQEGYGSLSFAVGIPGTVGGALVSNAGAYRRCIGDLIEAVEVVDGGERKWVEPAWMGFGYRDSVFRRGSEAVMLRAKLRLERATPADTFAAATDFQHQRISKQPPPASAGSFFKNVTDHALAAKLPGLTDGMRQAGVIPAGFLIEACGLKGARIGGAQVGVRHANFLLNVGGATATDVRNLARLAQSEVAETFLLHLQPEVLYVGDWAPYLASNRGG